MFVYSGWDFLFGVFIGLLIVPFIFTIEWVVQTLIRFVKDRLKTKNCVGRNYNKSNEYLKATGFNSKYLDRNSHPVLTNNKNENTCVYCGAFIPEGRLVCRNCEDAILKR